MSATEVAPPPVKRPFLRYWLPQIVLVLSGLALIGIWSWPSEDALPRVQRVSFTIMLGMLVTLLGAVWLLFLSGLRWWLRPLLVIGVAGAVYGSIREVRFDGALVPTFQTRWSPQDADRLEAHRQQHAAKASPAVELPEEVPSDFPEYRGRKRDGIVHGPVLSRDWKAQPPRTPWRQPVGGGYAAFAVAGPLAVTIEQRRDEEAVVGYDAATGRERWVHSYPAYFTEVLGGDGPRATPTIIDGEVYSVGATGVLVCLDAATGKLRWSSNILEDNDNIQWGMSGSPLVYDDVVVVTPGEQRTPAGERGVVAYARKTGKKVWSSGTTRGGYSSPMLATLAGKRQILVFDGEGCGGYDADGGKRLWFYPWRTERDMNIAQPIVLDGDRVFLSKSYNDPGCVLLKITQNEGTFQVEKLWKTNTLRTRFTSAVHHQGHFYGLNEGILECVDERDGKRVWKDGRYGNGQMLLVDGNLLILSEAGQFALVEASPKGYREITRIQGLEGDKTWNTPAVANGIAYVRNHLEMAAYDLREQGDDRLDRRQFEPPPKKESDGLKQFRPVPPELP